MKKTVLQQAGYAMPMVLGLIIAMTIIFSAVAGLIVSNITLVSNNIKSQKALNIAEAGINYYLWHLSHNSADYRDGKTTPTTPDATLGYGPYVHDYIDDFTNVTGTYTLWIKPEATGSTIMKVRSIGKVNGTNFTRTVEATLGAPSFASYGILADVAIWFGNTESANGPVFSNQGIRMDGPSTSDVVSARSTYTPPSSLGGDGSSKPGVWCHSSVTTPVNCNTRSKVDWLFPTSSIDFNQLSGSLCTIKKLAFQADAATSALASLANACSQVPTTRTAAYLPQRSTTSFNVSRGYLIQLNSNGTYDLYNVNGENDRLTPYTSALTLQSVASGITVPSSGVIFAEDNVWVRTNTTFQGRVTVGAGRLASATNSADINIADDVLYSAKNGSDAIGLIAENNIYISPYAAPSTGSFTFEVDAALIAQSGSVKYPGTYKSSSSTCTRGWKNSDQVFNYYGSIATRQTWTWLWVMNNSCGDAVNSSGAYYSGFINNSTQYDYNLLYAPPPSFPITSTYNILSWREVLTHP